MAYAREGAVAKKAKKKRAETDLHRPVCEYLTAQGYTIRSEVDGCDITALKGDDLVIVELKRRFDTKLLAQAAQRQKITDSVYVALPRPEDGMRTKRWRAIAHLLRRLELGLILVSFRRRKALVEIVFHPLPCARRKKKAARCAVLREIAGRSADYNRGGSVRRKLVTAYRENAIHIACCLDKFGPLAPRQLKALGTGPKTGDILRDNHYGWFERIAPGIYRLKPQGNAELKNYPELVRHYRSLLKRKQHP